MTLNLSNQEDTACFLNVILSKTNLVPVGAKNVKISNMSRIGTSVNAVYFFTLEFKNNNEITNMPLVIKIYEPTEKGKTRCERAYNLHMFLNSVNFPVPRVYFMEKTDNTLERPLMIMEGFEIPDVSHFLKHKTRNEIYKMLDRLAKTCVRLHQLEFNTLKEDLFPRPKDEIAYARKSALIKDEIDYAKNWDYAWVTDWLEKQAEKYPCKRYSILHVDMNFSNFLVQNDQIIITIDWEWAEIGDPLRDVANACYEIKHQVGEKAALFFLKQYMRYSKMDIDPSFLRFYLVASGLNLILFFRYLGTRKLGTREYLTRVFGKKYLLILPLLRWHFTRRRKSLENDLKRQVLGYEKLMFATPGGDILSQMEKQKVLKLTNATSSDRILDVGSGSGRIARDIISRTGAEVIGIDTGRPPIAPSRKNNLINLEWIVADGQHLPFKENSFDAIICIRTFKYFPDYTLALSELKRVLNRPGRLVIDFSSIFGYEIVLRHVTHSLGARGHHVFNIYKIKNMLNQYQLSIIQSMPLQKIPHPLWNLSSNSTVLNFLRIAENVLGVVTPELLSRSVLIKCIQ